MRILMNRSIAAACLTAAIFSPAFAGDIAPGSTAIDLSVSPDARVELNATWSPMVDSVYKLYEKSEELQGLSPDEETLTYSGKDVAGLLPDDPISVGDTWIPSDRAIRKFLRQFNDTATTTMHHGTGAGGSWAILRAASETHAEVLIRTHAEFIIAKKDNQSSFFTPAQFETRLVINREDASIESFHLELPSNNPNVDVNVGAIIGGNFYHAADIGFVPDMALRTEGAIATPDYTDAITIEKARRALAEKFYECAKVDWFEPEEALSIAKETGKPIHVVILFGALPDESCCGSGKTLRQSSLNNPSVVKMLDNHFVNVWMLGKDLDTFVENAEDPDVKKMFTILKDNYTYPVDTVIMTPDPKLVGHISVKDVFPLGQANYEDFLHEALKKFADE